MYRVNVQIGVGFYVDADTEEEARSEAVKKIDELRDHIDHGDYHAYEHTIEEVVDAHEE